MTRKPARDRYDAIVDLHPPKSIFNFAYAIVKQTYTIADTHLALAPPQPLAHDLRDEDAKPRMPPGSDFWLRKQATDVVVLGSAYAPAPVERSWVGIQVGRRIKQVQVFGDRVLEWTRGGLRFSAPEPFEVMPISNDRAYGGCDLRVPVAQPRDLFEAMKLEFDHPGVYPRNPFGKGYVVLDEPVDGVALPNLEDPGDLLTPERIVVGNPEAWWRQPLAWSLDWHHPLMFPRYVYLGADAWYPGPEDAALVEVERGYLRAHYRRDLITPFSWFGECPPAFYQEASLGLSFAQLEPGTPITVVGMDPEGRKLAFMVPAAPSIELTLEGDQARAQASLSQIVIEPDTRRVSLTWVARHPRMPRKFVPGIHGHIPLSVRVDGDEPILYETPTPIRTRLQQATRTDKEPA
jgi:hypothetical protein